MRAAKPQKPKKPYPDFPLFPHASGQWAKKIKGKFHYFGVWADWQAALDRYVEQRDRLFLRASESPGKRNATVGDLLHSFREFKQAAVNLGELAQHTFEEYQRAWDIIANVIGENRRIDAIGPAEFSQLRSERVLKISLTPWRVVVT